jgi:hypothetical protein
MKKAVAIPGKAEMQATKLEEKLMRVEPFIAILVWAFDLTLNRHPKPTP